DANFERLRALDRAFAVAGRAGLNILASAMAARALHVELHASAGLLDRAFAVTLRADTGSFDEAVSVTGGARVAARDVQTENAASDSRPERHVDLILKVGARLGPFFSGAAAAAGKHSGEDIAEASAARGCFAAFG